MTHASLFSGIGGFDLAAQWMGWENLFHCEWNPFCQTVLKHYWPNATTYTDITKTDFAIWRGRVDILTGGFPCQPFSNIGERKGTKDDRHLWPEMLRAIKEIRAPHIVGENVSGLINWDGGVVFDQVLSDLENEGYETQSFVLPACSVGAGHRRDRVWIIAHSERYRLERRKYSDKEGYRKKQSRPVPALVENRNWREFTKPEILNRFYGIPKKLDGITISDWRKESLKAAGNAIVPQIAYAIFQAIENTTTHAPTD